MAAVNGIPLRARMAWTAGFALLAAASVFIVWADLDGNGAISAPTASWVAFLMFSIALIAAANRAGRTRLSRFTALLLGVYCVPCVTLAVVRVRPYIAWRDIEFVLAAPGDSARTFLEMSGPAGIIAAVVAVVLAALPFSASIAAVGRELERSAWPAPLLLGITLSLAATFTLIGAPHARLSKYPKEYIAAGGIMPVVAKQPRLRFTRGESVFIVQMESVNGLLMNGDYVVDGKTLTGNFLPGMQRLAPRGISIPYFWGHDILTHRGQQAILCGAVRNLHVPYFDEAVPRTTDCLPELFRREGYRTVFLSNYWDGSFSGIETFMKRIGFRDLHFADFMKPNDPVSVWGFDERAFFTRAFDYLESRYGRDEKLFVYLAISSHHAGFTRERGSDLKWFLTADRHKRISQYLESARIQDESLLTFYQRFQRFTGGNAHAFFVADHGFPLGLYGGTMPGHGSTIDNYLTPFLYLPPAGRASEFALGRKLDDVVYAQSDLLPTIAELLTEQPHQNSMVPFMKREPAVRADYEPCQVMVQPLDDRVIIIARGKNVYEYSGVTYKLREYRLTTKPVRQVLVSQRDNVTFAEFDRAYGCKRYRPAVTTARMR